MGAEFLHADRQTGRQTDRQTDRQIDMTKIIVAFPKFANTLNNDNTKIYRRCLYWAEEASDERNWQML